MGAFAQFRRWLPGVRIYLSFIPSLFTSGKKTTMSYRERKAKRSAKTKSAAGEAHIQNLETKLQERLGTKVSLRYRKGKGSVDIKFFNDEDLQRILETLGVEAD